MPVSTISCGRWWLIIWRRHLSHHFGTVPAGAFCMTRSSNVVSVGSSCWMLVLACPCSWLQLTDRNEGMCFKEIYGDLADLISVPDSELRSDASDSERGAVLCRQSLVKCRGQSSMYSRTGRCPRPS